MALNVEAFHPERNEWIKLSQLNPGDRPASMSQNKPDGTREVYLFECAPDNSHSTVNRSTSGADASNPDIRIVVTEGLELIKELRRGDDPFVLTLLTDNSSQRRIMRFTHS
ncbi:MAG: hypothetical protein G01um10147_1174 [Microgenomates group bacterium Gr01-1014_7]|nr:MAG: hypothetical protein G01um10147_1174 [Microgenomates group bacterium Gr01-1014_7]